MPQARSERSCMIFEPRIIGDATLYLGKCEHVLPTLPENSVDSIVTDPPYELGFMGKGWDSTGIANDPQMWAECLRVLKPGGHLLAFSGSRTYHRMVCAIEDAGFQIRDQIMWIYGSGFPKSLNVAKAIDSGSGRPEDIRRMEMGDEYEPSGRGRTNSDHGAASAIGESSGDWSPFSEGAKKWNGWGTALKPAHEPICVARKPLIGTVAENVLAHGTGAMNIDGCRIDGSKAGGSGSPPMKMGGTNHRPFHDSAVPRDFDISLGRWPANVIHDGSAEVVAAFPTAPGHIADAKTSGEHKAANVYGTMRCARIDEPSAESENDGAVGFKMKPSARRLDSGSAARFFYSAKTSAEDRHEGLQDQGPRFSNGSTLRDAENLNAERSGNYHPTVKPTDLMAYLCRLVTPPGGTVLDPFMGSGSTGKACAFEQFRFIGVDMTPEYVDIAAQRIKFAQSIHVQAEMFA